MSLNHDLHFLCQVPGFAVSSGHFKLIFRLKYSCLQRENKLAFNYV